MSTSSWDQLPVTSSLGAPPLSMPLPRSDCNQAAANETDTTLFHRARKPAPKPGIARLSGCRPLGADITTRPGNFPGLLEGAQKSNFKPWPRNKSHQVVIRAALEQLLIRRSSKKVTVSRSYGLAEVIADTWV